MSSTKPPGARRHRAGMSAAGRAMWNRLYDSGFIGNLPWALGKPFAPLARALEKGWLSPPGPLLDVGAGTGSNSYWLAEQGYQVTGIDIARGAVSAARAARTPAAENPRFLVDDILASALPTRSYTEGIDVGCFQTLPAGLRSSYAVNLARLLTPGAPFVLFWVGREEAGSWGPPHRLSVTDVTAAFEPMFVIDQLEYRPRTIRLTPDVRKASRPLQTLAGYSARLLRRDGVQPPPR